MSQFATAMLHSMERIRSAPLRFDPFAHVYVEEIFPPAFYAELQKRLLKTRHYKRLLDTGRVGPTYSPARFCLMLPDLRDPAIDTDDAAFWKELFLTYNSSEFTQLWIETFRAPIAERLKAGKLPPGRGDIAVKSEIFLMRDLETYELNPHTDSPSKIVSVLFYLPPDNSNPHLGTTLYTPKEEGITHEGGYHVPRGHFNVAATMPYKANTLFAFPKTSACFHGVEPLTQQECRRDIMLFDIKFK